MNDTYTNDTYGHVLKYTSLFGGVQGLNIIMGLVRNKLVALLLGPYGMGVVALLNSALTFISQATNLGISFSAVRHVSELADCDDENRIMRFIKTVRAWSLVAAIGGMLVCILLGPVLSDVAFAWGDHTLHFLLLSPAVAMMAITGGETAILKGMRQLRPLAITQVWTVIASLVIAVPIYYFFGVAGVVPVIILMALTTMLFTLHYSLRLHPLHLNGLIGVLGEGKSMVRLGLAFILASIVTSGAELIVRAYLNYNADSATVGLYNAAYVLTITYAGMVFSAMETDYFPRLSAVNHDTEAVNLTVNRQIEVCILIISPMLSTLIVSLPLLVPLLYSGKFMPIIPVAKLAVLAMYFRAMALSVAYIVLAKGRSVTFFVLETMSSVAFVLLIVCGFNLWGLLGTGVALLLNEVFYLILVFSFSAVSYRYRPSRSVLLYMLVQLPIGVAAYCVSILSSGAVYMLLSVLLVAASTSFSVYVLYKKTSLWNKLKDKILRRNNA